MNRRPFPFGFLPFFFGFFIGWGVVGVFQRHGLTSWPHITLATVISGLVGAITGVGLTVALDRFEATRAQSRKGLKP